MIRIIIIILTIAGFLIAEENLKLDFPAFEEFKLENGLKVIIAEHHEQPAVFFNIRIDIGGLDVPIGKEGLNEVVFDLLKKGTEKYTADELSAVIDATGGSISTGSQLEYSTIKVQFLKEDMELGLNLIAEILLKPTFSKNEFKLAIKQYKEGVKTWYSDPGSVASAHANKLLYGDSPMGNQQTQNSLKSLSLNDVLTFYKSIIPSKVTLVAIGDFESENIKDLVESLFGDWQSNESSIERGSRSNQKIEGLRFRFVENPELEQATVQIKQPGIPFNSQDFWALRLANYVFGGGSFSSRLMEVVRSEGGKSYGIYSWCEYSKTYGAINIKTSTRSNELLNTYKLITQELDRITSHTITEKELKKAKSYYIGNIPLSLESPASIADKILQNKYYGLSIDDLENQLIKMDNTTLEEVNAVASQYYDPDNYVLVIVGKSEAIRDSLSQIGQFDEAFYKDDVK